MGRTFQIIGVCVLAVALGASQGQPISSRQTGDQSAERGNARLNENAPAASPPAMPTSSPEMGEAAAQARQETQRAEADLKAQQEMALWAFGMFIASIISVVIGALGVGLIYTTFQQTRRAADSADEMVKETNRATAAAIESAASARLATHAGRAWMMPTSPRFATFDGWVNDVVINKGCALAIGMKNSGQSPALDVTSFREFVVVPVGTPLPPTPERPDPNEFAIIGPGAEFTCNLAVLNDDQALKF